MCIPAANGSFQRKHKQKQQKYWEQADASVPNFINKHILQLKTFYHTGPTSAFTFLYIRFTVILNILVTLKP